MSVTIGTQRVNVDYFLVALSVKSVNKILSISGCEPPPLHPQLFSRTLSNWAR